jgi:hypothetical protein
LDITGEADGAPSDRVTITAVFRCAVHPLAGVFEEETEKLAIGSQSAVLFIRFGGSEVGAQAGQSLAIALLESDDRAIELAFGQVLGTLNPSSPGQLVERSERMELLEARVPTRSTRSRSSSPDAGRVKGKRAEQGVDVVG